MRKHKFRRHREGRTDYRYRLKLLRSGLPRVVVRRSLRYIQVQFIEYVSEGSDRVITSASSRELYKYGWQGSASNTPAGYLTGILAGKRAKAKGIERAVLDLGRRHRATRGCRAFAVLKGVLESGIQVPHDPAILPSESRLRGEHLSKPLKREFIDAMIAKLHGEEG